MEKLLMTHNWKIYIIYNVARKHFSCVYDQRAQNFLTTILMFSSTKLVTAFNQK